MTITIHPTTYKSNLLKKLGDTLKTQVLSQDQYKRFARRELGITPLKNMAIDKRGICSPHPCIDIGREIDERLSEPYLIGCELEIEHNKINVNEIKEKIEPILKSWEGEYYCCTDGSLRNGIEIVFAPRSIKEWQSRYTKLLILLKSLSKLGFVSHDSGRCGLHFHVSRRGLANERWLQLGRFICSNKSFFARISRRDGSNQYCKFIRSQTDRYCAINYTNSNTIEFRFFRGTLSPTSFIASLETVIGLVTYYEQDKKRLGIVGFRKHVENRDNLKHAAKYLVPHWPTVQERKKYTEQEKQARKVERESMRLYRNLRVRDIINYHLVQATNKYRTHLLRHLTSENEALRTITIPVRLNGFNRDIRAVAKSYTPIVQVLAPAKFSPSYIADIRRYGLSITKRTGWGKSRVTYSLPTF